MLKTFRTKSGQSTLEMALILPVLLVLLFGIMEMGRVLGGYLELQNAARDGVRYAAVNSVLSADAIKDYTLDRLVVLDRTKLEDPATPDRFTYTNITEIGPPAKGTVRITVYYPMDIITPLIGDIVGDTVTLHVSMAMRRE